MASTLSLVSSLFLNPLFSSIVTLYILILLYFPHFLLTTIISFSPLFISTLILLLFLLRLGASQGLKSHNDDPNWAETRLSSEPEPEPEPVSLVESGEKQGAKTEEPCKWIETREATDHGPEPEWCDQGWADFDPSQSGEEGKEAELQCNRVETRFVIEAALGPEPVKLENSAKAEHYCHWVKTRTLSELGPDTEAKTEPLYNWVETRITTESRPELRPEPDLVDPGWAKFDSCELGEEEKEAEPYSNRVETQPSTEPGPGPEPNWCYQGWDFEKVEAQVETRPASDPGQGAELNLQFEIEPKPELEKSAVPDQEGWSTRPEPDSGPNMFCREWDVGAPLEVIYEAYEGEEDEDEGQNDAFNDDKQMKKIVRYPSLSRYYPESESDSDPDSSESSLWDGEFPAMEQWDDDDDDDEEEREGLIEIALGFNHHHQHGNTTNKEIKKLVDDEDNLIEIDISPTRTNHEFSW